MFVVWIKIYDLPWYLLWRRWACGRMDGWIIMTATSMTKTAMTMMMMVSFDVRWLDRQSVLFYSQIVDRNRSHRMSRARIKRGSTMRGVCFHRSQVSPLSLSRVCRHHHPHLLRCHLNNNIYNFYNNDCHHHHFCRRRHPISSRGL